MHLLDWHTPNHACKKYNEKMLWYNYKWKKNIKAIGKAKIMLEHMSQKWSTSIKYILKYQKVICQNIMVAVSASSVEMIFVSRMF